MKNFIIRAISGIIYAGLIIAMLFFGGQYGFAILCALAFAGLGTGEFFTITGSRGGQDIISLFDRLAVIIIALLPVINSMTGLNIAICVAIVTVIIRCVLQLYAHDHSPAQRMAMSLMSYLYISTPIAILSSLYMNYGAALVFVIFAMIWLNDTGAYLVGVTLGRHRLFKRISPKKSWEGFFGGMLFAIATGALVSLYIPQLPTGLTTWQLSLMGLVVCISATYGDLFESMLKRAAGVKDSGNIMPGHGGILDRIDSLLFVAPATWLLLLLFTN